MIHSRSRPHARPRARWRTVRPRDIAGTMVDGAARHALYRSLEAAIGPEATGTMMTLLPPVGWAEVATKDDLRQLEARLDGRVDSLEHRLGGRMDQRMAELESRLTAAMRTQLFALLGAMFSISALTVAASAVLG